MKKGETKMEKKNFMTANEIAEELGVAPSTAYKIIRKLNKELQEQGCLTVAGKLNTKYFQKRFYYEENK